MFTDASVSMTATVYHLSTPEFVWCWCWLVILFLVMNPTAVSGSVYSCSSRHSHMWLMVCQMVCIELFCNDVLFLYKLAYTSPFMCSGLDRLHFLPTCLFFFINTYQTLDATITNWWCVLCAAAAESQHRAMRIIFHILCDETKGPDTPKLRQRTSCHQGWLLRHPTSPVSLPKSCTWTRLEDYSWRLKPCTVCKCLNKYLWEYTNCS